MLPGSKTQDELPRIKKNVEKAYQYSSGNYKRFANMRRFIYKSTLSDTDFAYLTATQKPQVEFNVGEAYISRLRGEFAEQIPDIEVGSDSSTPLSIATIDIVEGHIRHIFCDKALLPNSIYEEELSGGFSVMKVYTDYENEMTFHQCIKIKKAYDPTLVGFDPMAVEPTKCDGNFCFEAFPMTVEDFKREHPSVDLSTLKYANASFEGFNWAYKGSSDDILLVVDYYEKRKKKAKLLYLSNGKNILEKDYKDYLAQWEASGRIEQPPVAINSRPTTITTIVRHRLIQDKILQVEETDYGHLPLIYISGSTQRIKSGTSESVEEIARSYLYHALDAIRMKNYAGQCLLNELENLVQHKFVVAKESIPDEQDYRAAYTNVQTANTLVYNAFLDDDPNVPLPPPSPIQRPPIPQEIMMAFTSSDSTIQSILGSYDAASGNTDGNILSGKAIIEGATHSNAAAMPFVMGYLEGLEQAAKIIISLIPKYFKTPRTIPVINKEGKRSFVSINDSQDNQMGYAPDALNVKVRAGANFSVQKNRAIQQVIALSRANEAFGAFFNQKGLPVILDNLEIRGIEKLKDLGRQWQQQMQMQQQMAMQQPNPAQIKAQIDQQKLQIESAKLQKELQELQIETQLRSRELSIKEQDAHNESLRILMESEEAHQNSVTQLAKAAVEEKVHLHDMATKTLDMHHRHAHDKAKLAHEIITKRNESVNTI